MGQRQPHGANLLPARRDAVEDAPRDHEVRLGVVMAQREACPGIADGGRGAQAAPPGRRAHAKGHRSGHRQTGYIMTRLPRSMTPELSIVIPVYNESPNIKPLYDELTEMLGQYGAATRSSSWTTGARTTRLNSWPAPGARSAAARDPVPPQFRPDRGVFRRLRLRSRPAGGAPPTAISRTIPATFPPWSPRIEQGHDIVCGWRKDRKDTFFTRRVPSMIANRMISWATGVELHDYGCSLKVFRAEVVKPLRLYGEMHRSCRRSPARGRLDRRSRGQPSRARAGHSKYGICRARFAWSSIWRP